MFVDFKQAYDSVHRLSMWKILREFHIPSKLIALIKAAYNGTGSMVRVGNKTTNYFDIESGLRQGCVLS